ncbi:MAG: hypothetical protein RLZZ08_1860 [Pseudomonadota bacterium]|jgi:hypothetical protein
MKAALSFALLLALSVPASAQDKHPDLTGFWGADFKPAQRDATLLGKLPQGSVVIEDTGVAEFPRGEFGGLKLTAAARAHAEQWKPEDEMTLQRVCAVPSIVYSVQGPFPFEVEEAAGVIVFRYEYFDQIRLIWMDGRTHPAADGPHTKMGHSVGHWDGDELVIDTTNIAASTITNNGLDHSDAIHMVERYKLSADGKALMATQWFEDPTVLENTGARYITWTRKAGQHVFPYECDPSFALEYQQVGKPSAD